jgi:MFS family permease
MKAPGSFSQWAVAAAGGGAVLTLSLLGARLAAFGLIVAPAIIGISGWIAQRLPGAVVLVYAAIVCAVLGVNLSPMTGYFFMAATLSGLLLPELLGRQPGEDDCFFLLPALCLAVLAVLIGIDLAGRGGAGWEAFQAQWRREVAEARQMKAEANRQARLTPETPGPWTQADRLLPCRVVGTAAAFAAIVFYFGAIPFRRWLSPVRAEKNRFIFFRVKEVYLGVLIVALAALAAWTWHPWPPLGHVAYALLFLSGAALVLETVSLGAFLASGDRLEGSGALGAAAAAAVLLVAPVLIAPCAVVGLADVWLDFRGLDRILRQTPNAFEGV